MTKNDKEAFMGGVEMGIDWNLPMPLEDVKRYHQLLEERTRQHQQEQEILQDIAKKTSLEFAQQAADILNHRKHMYSYEVYLAMLRKLQRLIDAGMSNCVALEAVQSGIPEEAILATWKTGNRVSHGM